MTDPNLLALTTANVNDKSERREICINKEIFLSFSSPTSANKQQIWNVNDNGSRVFVIPFRRNYGALIGREIMRRNRCLICICEGMRRNGNCWWHILRAEREFFFVTLPRNSVWLVLFYLQLVSQKHNSIKIQYNFWLCSVRFHGYG